MNILFVSCFLALPLVNCAGNYLSVEKFTRECGYEGDIVFLLDVSGSVGPRNFQKVKTFASEVSRAFKIGRRFVRIAVVRFSSTSTTDIDLEDRYNFHDKYNISTAIRNITYGTGGTTNTAQALLDAQNMTSSSTRDVPKVIILVTDGLSINYTATSHAAQVVHSSGTIVISIGVGKHMKDEELLTIASDPRHVFKVNNFHGLAALNRSLSVKICEVIRYVKDNPLEKESKCVYEQSGFIDRRKTFGGGATWYDGCKYKCFCKIPERNGLLLQERCPTWKLTESCKAVSQPEECACPKIICK